MIEPNCPTCTTKGLQFALSAAIERYPGLFGCENCERMFQKTHKGELVDVSPILEKLRMSDDLMSAVSADTTVSGSIQDLVLRYRGASDELWLGFVGSLNARLQQAEARAHFLVGEIAKRAMADASLEPLLETAKQVKDLVSSRPDGITMKVE